MARPATGSVVKRAAAGGRITYALRFRAYGERRYLTLGPDWTEEAAFQRLEEVLDEVAAGTWPPLPAKRQAKGRPRPQGWRRLRRLVKRKTGTSNMAYAKASGTSGRARRRQGQPANWRAIHGYEGDDG